MVPLAGYVHVLSLINSESKSVFSQASTKHEDALIKLDVVKEKCAEEFAQNMIDDTEKDTLEYRSAAFWKAVNPFWDFNKAFDSINRRAKPIVL